MNNYKSILLLKLPYCIYVEHKQDTNFMDRTNFRPIPSIALASICGFFDKYKSTDYTLKAIDINIEAYQKPGEPIDPSLYKDLLTDAIKDNDYGVLALSAMFLYNIRWVELAVRLSRQYHPEAKIIIGGGYPTVFPKEAVEKHDIDFAVIGEGEATFLHILNKINNHTDLQFEKNYPFENYATKDDAGRVIVIPRKTYTGLEGLPSPNWDYLNVEKYFKNSGDRVLPMESSRGCPYTCTFCASFLAWGRKMRYKPVDNVIAEVQKIYSKYKVSGVYFMDDNISFSRTWVVELLNKLIKLALPMKVSVANFSVKHLDEELIDLWVKVGCDEFLIAVETGSPEMQKKIHKNIDLAVVRNLLQIFQRKKIHVIAMYMIGFPGETLSQINETLNAVKSLRASHSQLLLVVPFPGTQLFSDAMKDSLLNFDVNDLEIYQRSTNWIKSEEWDYPLLKEMVYDVNIEVNFLNNSFCEFPEGRKYKIDFYKSLLKGLPGHVIAHIMLGYLTKDPTYYSQAKELLKSDSLNQTFGKYLSWNFPAVVEFKQYLQKEMTASGVA